MGCVVRTGSGVKEINYQDVWFQGRPIISGGRECEFRYYAIEKYLKKFKRPISVLDIGANMGYFSIRLMERFKGTFVMIEGHESTAKGLVKVCKLNNNRQAIMLKQRLCLADLKALSEAEHFDVVFALSIIHHFEEPYQEVLHGMAQLGSVLILEPPSLIEHTLNQDRIVKEPLDLSTFNKKVLCRTLTGSKTRSTIYRETYAIECSPQKILKKPYFLAPEMAVNPLTIQADFKKRKVIQGNTEFDWHHGINLSTFLALQGMYPTKQRLLSLLQELKIADEEMINPWDFVLTGTHIKHISGYLRSKDMARPEDMCAFGALKDHIFRYLPEN